MPNQMPPAARMAGESVSTMIMSRPGAMPSLRTPMTWAVNGSGMVPLLTVYPVPVRPAVTWLTGTAAGHGSAGAAWPAAGPASAPSPSSAAIVTATHGPGGLGPGAVRRGRAHGILLVGGGRAASRPLRWTWVVRAGPGTKARRRLPDRATGGEPALAGPPAHPRFLGGSIVG